MSKIEELIQFIHLVHSYKLNKADAIVCLEGDGFFRLNQAARLFKMKMAPLIVISGGFNNPPFSFAADKMAKKLIELGVPASRIIVEKESQNTHQQALAVIKLAKNKKWRKIILVASHFHQCRAFLTFLAVRQKTKSNLLIINSPVKDISWFDKIVTNKKEKFSRLELLISEFKKIETYQKKGHVASFKEAIKYQKEKNRQS